MLTLTTVLWIGSIWFAASILFAMVWAACFGQRED